VNLFSLPAELPAAEFFERVAGGGDVLVERIVSKGQATRPGEWLVQERDEWVVVLQGRAELSLEDGAKVPLAPGDHVLIPSGRRHRVERTSSKPPCIWLAVHAPRLGA
jgi:cupin 2 domain-containing protein